MVKKGTERFWERVQDAFNNANAPEIARRLGLEKQAVYKWRDGNLPGVDTLLAISKTTGCSLHWLLTGEGSKEVSNVATTAVLKIESELEASSLSSEARAAIRREILEVLSGLLLSSSDRALADSLLDELRQKIQQNTKKSK